MNKKTMIKIDHVSKEYRLGAIGGTTLRDDLARFIAKKRGKEDPTIIIGQENKHFGERFLALDDVSFEVKEGEAVGIIGRNGAGKSTLLKLISRITAPTKGMIGLNGRVASMLEVGTGFHPELTGRENIYMNGAILGMTKTEIENKIEDIIDFSEVREFIDTPVKRYSSGMYVKLAFSVAAHLDSEIMIMDEVLAVGDMAFQKKCLEKMSDASRTKGKTVLYVSHNMNTIKKLCTRCIVLDKGKIIYNGNVDEAISIYMNYEDTRLLKYDFSNVERFPNESRKLQMLGIDILNPEGNTINVNDSLLFRLRTKVNSEFESLGFRLEIFFNDRTLAGTVFADQPIMNNENRDYLEIEYKFDLKNFAPGKYYAVALLYEKDSYGNQVCVDRVEPAMFFEIVSSYELEWLHQYWGHVRFDDLVTMSERC